MFVRLAHFVFIRNCTVYEYKRDFPLAFIGYRFSLSLSPQLSPSSLLWRKSFLVALGKFAFPFNSDAIWLQCTPLGYRLFGLASRISRMSINVKFNESSFCYQHLNVSSLNKLAAVSVKLRFISVCNKLSINRPNL